MDLLLVNGHRQVPGYLPGSNLGMNILLQLARKKGYEADMLQDYVGRIVRKLDLMAETDSFPKVMGFYTDFNNITWTKKLIAPGWVGISCFRPGRTYYVREKGKSP